jgi:hypothetical protein
VLHYFCDFAAGKQRSATFNLQSLLHQMLLEGDNGHISIMKRCRERSSTPPRFKDLLQAFIDMCKLQAAGPHIVLDALDELEDRKILLPLQVLGQFVEAGCRVFTTSRPILDIEGVLSGSEQVELEANPDDLKLFIESELQASDFAHVADTSDIVNRVIDQAGGMYISATSAPVNSNKTDRFLLARLLMSHFLTSTTREQIRRSLEALPSNLTAAYQSSLDRILAQPPTDAALALRVIGWMIHTERLLTTAELLHAFAVEDDTDGINNQNLISTPMLLQVCVGLVILNEDTTISLVHATVHTFFADMPE